MLASVLVLACASGASHQAPSTTSSLRARAIDDSLHHELLRRLELDQRARERLIAKGRAGQPLDSADLVRIQTVDSSNTEWLKELLQKHSWPTRSAVGPDGASAAFVLVQHADRDTAFQIAALPLITEAVAIGEADGQELALLTDRLAVARGQLQVYGTQADVTDGHTMIKPIVDSVHVDERRLRLGLPPLATYARVLDSVYARRPRP